MVGDGVVVSADDSSEVLEDEGNSCSDGGGDWGTHLFFKDVLVHALGWNGEEALLSDCEDLAGQEGIVSGLAELIDVFGEDVGNEEHVGWVGIGSGDGVGVDAVKGGVDLEGGASGSLGDVEVGDTIDGVSGIRKMVVVLTEFGG